MLPFTKQYFHLRDLQRSGESPQFGSFLYTAKDLYDKGILLSIDQYSPRQFDKLQLTLSSRKAGVFTLLLETTLMGVLSRIASEDIRMEDLLQAKYEKRSSLSLLNNRVKVNFELFLYQINKKWVLFALFLPCVFIAHVTGFTYDLIHPASQRSHCVAIGQCFLVFLHL